MKKIKSFVLIIIILLIWQIVSMINIFPIYMLPSPIHIINEFYKMVITGEIIFHILISFRRVFIGFIFSFLLGFLFGILNSIFEGSNIYYFKLLEFLRHIPPISLVPLFILWFGIGELSKILVIILTAFSPIFINTYNGIENCDKKLLEVGDIFNMTKFEKLYKIKIPYAIPQIISGMKIGLGYSFRAIVGAEMISAMSGIGYFIMNAQALFKIDKMIVGIILIGIIGLLTDYFFDKISIKLLKKYYYK